MTSNWELSVALLEMNSEQGAASFICHHEFSLLSLIFCLKKKKRKSREKNDMFFCHQERKAEPGSLNALGLVLWKCFSCATGLTDCLFFFFLTSLQSDLWAQRCFTAAWCSCVQFSVLLLEAGGRRAADQSMRRIFIRGCGVVVFSP